MKNIKKALGLAASNLSDKSYEKSFAHFRLWFGIAQTHFQIPSDLIFDTIFTDRAEGIFDVKYTYPTAHLILRLVNDVELDPTLAPHGTGLRSLFCARILQEFFDNNLSVRYTPVPAMPRAISTWTSISSHTVPISDTSRNMQFVTTSSSHSSLMPRCTTTR